MKKLSLYESKASFTDYPQSASDNAKKAIEWAEKHGWGSCGTAVGKKRAHQLANREPLSRDVVGRMASFNRHKQNSKRKLGDGCGRLMWLAWGGDSGINWAKRKMQQINESLSDSLISDIKYAYDAGHEYFKGEIHGQEFKIRMNKDHARNKRNDDPSVHNLSLVNCKCPEAVAYRISNQKYIQVQRDKIYDWEDAKYEIEDFLERIKEMSDVNESKSTKVYYHGTNVHPSEFKLDPDWDGDSGNVYETDLPEGYLFLTDDIREAKAYGRYIIKCKFKRNDKLIVRVKGNNPSQQFDDDYSGFGTLGAWSKFVNSGKSILQIKGDNKSTYITDVENVIPII